MIKKIAFVTYSVAPEIQEDDLLLVDALAKRDVSCYGVSWEDPAIDWKNFDLILIRSCWNYHLKEKQFRNWIHSLKNIQARLINSSTLVEWNLNKNYLLELSSFGVPIPETITIQEEAFYPEKLYDWLIAKDWSRAVLKPCVSASSFNTQIITRENAIKVGQSLTTGFPTSGMILQEFAEEILREGELSLMFFNNEYAHAVVKTAKAGEFRVQKQFGGMVKSYDASPELIVQAKSITEKIPDVPMYARIDGFVRKDKFYLMEAELIEPVLFFGQHPSGATLLADQLLTQTL